MKSRSKCQNSNNQDDIYYSYVDNLQSIENAINDVHTIIRMKISKKEETTQHFDSSIKLLILQLGIWSEARFHKLLNEYDTQTNDKFFTELEHDFLNLKRQKIEQWKTIIELSFRKHYNIYIGHELSETNLGLDRFKQYNNLIEIIEKYLRSIIEIRNKLAHGQWSCQLSDKGKVSNNPVFQTLKDENIVSLQIKHQILKFISQIIHDLVISKKTFERDFEKLYKEIIDRQKFLEKHVQKEYIKLIQQLQS